MQTWTGFYAVTAAAAATLLGLLFVAVSMHALAIMGEGHEASKRMAEQAFQNYLAVILVSLLALFPQLQLRSFGLTALALTAVGDVWVLVRLIQTLTRPHDRQGWFPSMRRHFASLVGYALLFYAALRMALGDSDSRNAFAVMVLVSSATVMSWELLIGLAKARLSPKIAKQHPSSNRMTSELSDDLAARRAKVHLMGGEAKLAARRERGVLNARERIDLLCDPGSFSEIGEFAHSARAEDKDRSPADGIVTGFGKVDGRNVAVASFDLTMMGASSTLTNIRKLGFLKESAARAGIPCAFLIESAGARMPDIQGAVGMGRVGMLSQTDRDRSVPWVTAVLGPCYGMGAWYTVQADFSVMRRDATFSVSSPKVISVALSQELTPEQLGGSDVHADVTGLIDQVTDTDEEAIAALRKFLSYMPANNAEAPPTSNVPVEAHPDSAVDTLIPVARNKVYDGRKLIEYLADVGSVMPYRTRYGRTLETALVRLDGQVAGIIASNPMRKGGAIDGPSCDKMTEFVVLCDSFNIPIVILADTPGFLVGLQPELDGVAGKIMNNLRALALATVPKVAVVVRKSYGQAYINLGGGIADVLATMTTGEVGFVDPAVGVSVVHNRKPEQDDAEYAALLDQMVVSNSPYELAGIFAAQAVITPGETRGWLIRMLDVYRLRPTNGVGQHRLATWPTSL